MAGTLEDDGAVVLENAFEPATLRLSERGITLAPNDERGQASQALQL